MSQILERVHGLGIRTRIDISDEMLSNIQSATWFCDIKKSSETIPEKVMFFEFSKDASKIPENLHALIREKLFSSIDMENNFLIRAHKELASVYVLAIPENSDCNIELTIDSFGNSFNHLIVLAEKNCKAKIFIEIYSMDSGIKTLITETFVGKNSHIYFNSINKLSVDDIHYAHNAFEVEKHSTLNYTSMDFGSRKLVRDGLIVLKGDESRAFSNNIYSSKNNSSFDIYTIVTHQGRDTNSLMKHNGVLKDARTITRGLIRIKESAFNSNGYQRSNALLTDDKSRAVSIPDLEIHNNEVKCTHGSSLTTIDSEKLFYMQSRGLNKEDAEKHIIEGFYYDSLSAVDNDDVKDDLFAYIREELGVVNDEE